jgi:spermidine/putrescine transport system ATP-binding protein
LASIDVELRNVTKKFGEFVAVDQVSLEIEDGEFFSLLGPSGCGKTTTLRMIAGLEQPTAGEVYVVGQPMAGVPAFERNTNMVFQNYALFPHMTVAENVAFGLEMKRVSKAERKQRVAEALELVRLPRLESSGSPWLGPWSTGRPCCCWTSPLAPWTSSCANKCNSS